MCSKSAIFTFIFCWRLDLKSFGSPKDGRSRPSDFFGGDVAGWGHNGKIDVSFVPRFFARCEMWPKQLLILTKSSVTRKMYILRCTAQVCDFFI